MPLLRTSRRWFPFVERVFADTAYAAERVANATRIVVDIVRKLPDQVGFAVLPRRWVVERFLAWINRNRRLAKDFEGTLASATAFIYAASVMLLTRRLARSPSDSKSNLSRSAKISVMRYVPSVDLSGRWILFLSPSYLARSHGFMVFDTLYQDGPGLTVILR